MSPSFRGAYLKETRSVAGRQSLAPVWAATARARDRWSACTCVSRTVRMCQPFVSATRWYTWGSSDASITAAAPCEPMRYERQPFPVRRSCTIRAVLPGYGTSAVFQARLQARIPPSSDTASRPRARKRSAASMLVFPAAHTVTTRPPLLGWKSSRTVGSPRRSASYASACTLPGIDHSARSTAGRTSRTVTGVPRSSSSRRRSVEMVGAVIGKACLGRGLLRREQHCLYAIGLGRVSRRFLPECKARDYARAHALEPRFLEQCEHLSLRESAADSAGPELGIVDDGLRELFRTHDVGDREPASGLEDAEQLSDHGALAKGEVDDAVRDHHVHARIGQRNVLHPSLVARHPHAGSGGMRLRLATHRRVQIDADHPALRPHLPPGDDTVETGSAPQVQHHLPGLEAAAQVWVPYACERRHGAGRRAIEPLGLIAEHLGCLTPVVEVELPFGVLGHFLIHPQDLTLDHSLERGLLVRVKQCDVGHGRAWRGSSFGFT